MKRKFFKVAIVAAPPRQCSECASWTEFRARNYCSLCDISKGYSSGKSFQQNLIVKLEYSFGKFTLRILKLSRSFSICPAHITHHTHALPSNGKHKSNNRLSAHLTFILKFENGVKHPSAYRGRISKRRITFTFALNL